MYAHYFTPRSSLIVGASASITKSDEQIKNHIIMSESKPIFVHKNEVPYSDDWFGLTHNKMDFFEPGVYAEYTYTLPEKFSFVLGLRGDWMGAKNIDAEYPVGSVGHFDYNAAYYTPKERFVLTPRTHIRWDITPSTVLRGSAGLGYRRASIFTDNIWMLATGRMPLTKGLTDDIEMALTAGGSLTQYIKWGGYSDATISFDYFRTQLFNTVLADQELGKMGGTPEDEIWIYNTDGRSFTDTYQVDFQWTPVKGLDLFATYRYTNAKVSLLRDGVSHLVERPLTSRFKTLLNIQYATAYRRWVFDVTAQYNGPMRRPSLDGDITRSELSPAYPMFYAQVSHKIRDWEIYVGCENILDYMQKDPILNAADPFSPAFNSSSVWGPLMGRKFYIGLRFNLY
jgi:outer membrane receptor protein involved in Fe transport